MFVENFLLPRFLILELVFAFHYLEYTKAVNILTCESKKVSQPRKGIYELQEILEHDDQDLYSYRFSHVSPAIRGAAGLKNFLQDDGDEIDYNEELSDEDEEDEGPGDLRDFYLQGEGDNIEEEEEPDYPSDITAHENDNESSGEEVKVEGPPCKFSLQGQHWKFPPLLFTSKGNPILPIDNANNPDMVVEIGHGEPVTVFCPGKKVKNSLKDTVIVNCHEGDKFILDSIIIDIDQLGCVGNPSEAEIVPDGLGECGPDDKGQISQIGYVLSEIMYPIITVCHDDDIEETFYTNHTLHGKFLHYKSIYERRHNFREGRLYFKSISANDAYRQAKQKKIFSSLLPDETCLIDYYNPGDGLYFARGHLAPRADLLYTDWQEASYMYSNVVPQWQRINNGNWRTVEEAVRAAARRRGVTFQVYTGAYGRYQVNSQDVFMVDKKIPVPEYLWKLVVDTNTGESVVFVTLNNPFVRHLTRSYNLCEDICDTTRWFRILKRRMDPRKGYTICCKPSDLRTKIPWLPRAEQSQNILIF